MKTRALSSALLTVALLALSGCDGSSSKVAEPMQIAASPATPSPFKVTASVQELMESIVDPSADGVWDSVGTIVTKKGIENHQPRTDEEWKQVRLRALALIEGTNLLMMDGRRLIAEGGKIADDGADGVLKTADAEQLLKTEHATFVQFARGLNDAGTQMLKAIDARQPEAMMEAGEVMDEVCESCHMKFWYPNQAVWTVSKGVSNSTSAKPAK